MASIYYKRIEMYKQLQILILSERLEFYKDFMVNLLYTINDYYLDKTTLAEPSDINNHFKWCYNKVADEFKKEGFDFTKNKDLYRYLSKYFKGHIYNNNLILTKDDIDLKFFHEILNNIFEFNKTDQDLIKLMMEVYSLFDKTISEKNNIYDLV